MRVWWAFVALGVAFGLGACSDVKRQHLEVLASPFIKPVYEKLVGEFSETRAAAPAQFAAGPREEDQLVQQLLRLKLVGGVLPDVVFMGGNRIRTLAEQGLAVPLDAFIEADPDWKQGRVSSAVTAAGRVNGKTYGIAFGFSLPVVLFNSELVRRAGGDPERLPSDWPEIVTLAQRIDRLGNGVVGGFVEYDNGGAFSFLSLLNSHGGRLLTDDERNVAFDDERGLRTLQIYRDFGTAGQARADMTRDQARQAFGAGSIGIFVTMSSVIPRLEETAGERFDVLSMPLPLDADGGRVPAAGPVAVMLTRDPARQREALELMKFACSTRGQMLLAQGSGYAPANEVAIQSSPQLKALLAGRRNAPAYLERLDDATDWYSPPGPNTTRITDAIVLHLQQVVTLKASPETALRAMETEVTSMLPTS
jgi:multiple sugar transport system substrate-binding protein